MPKNPKMSRHKKRRLSLNVSQQELATDPEIIRREKYCERIRNGAGVKSLEDKFDELALAREQEKLKALGLTFDPIKLVKELVKD